VTRDHVTPRGQVASGQSDSNLSDLSRVPSKLAMGIMI